MPTERFILLKPGHNIIEHFANSAFSADGSITDGGDEWGESAGKTATVDDASRSVVCASARMTITK